jgi:hypothetical protein
MALVGKICHGPLRYQLWLLAHLTRSVMLVVFWLSG